MAGKFLGNIFGNSPPPEDEEGEDGFLAKFKRGPLNLRTQKQYNEDLLSLPYATKIDLRPQPLGKMADTAPVNPWDTLPGGGIRAGKASLFLPTEEMPRLRPELIANACDNLVRGRNGYNSLLYLSRVKIEDIPSIFVASSSPEIRVRWERLWVLSPYFSRLSRTAEGRAALLEGFKDDLAALHLISKFAEQNNYAVKRLFKRMHDALLELLISKLGECAHDPRRASLMSSMISIIETDSKVLEAVIEQQIPQDLRPHVLPWIFVKYRDPRFAKLSSEILREKLQNWSKGY